MTIQGKRKPYTTGKTHTDLHRKTYPHKKKPSEIFEEQTLNVKFTCVILLFLAVAMGIFGAVLFRNMEDSVIEENRNQMYYTMERNEQEVQARIDSAAMSTQFFLSDEKLQDLLYRYKQGKKLSIQEWVDLKNGEIAGLERLVNNNPLLYGVRVYALADNITEIMPILYRQDRMKQQPWAKDERKSFWAFDYNDQIFTEENVANAQKLAGFITQVWYDGQQIGVVESMLTMDEMFPELYEDQEEQWSFFVTDSGQLCYGTADRALAEELTAELFGTQAAEKETASTGNVQAGKETVSTAKAQAGNERAGETAATADTAEIATQYIRMNRRHLVISDLPLAELGGTLIGVNDITEEIHNVYRMRDIFVLSMVALLGVISFFINAVVKHLLAGFYAIVESIRQVQKGDLSIRIEHCGKDESGELGMHINKMLDRIVQLMDENVNRERLVKDSQIRALQNQINAHFIYNVLESIKMTAEIEGEYGISDAVTALGKMLRYNMKWSGATVQLSEELDYVRHYLLLMNLRLDYTIELKTDVPKEFEIIEVPKMSSQPIVENAVLHGIEEIAEDAVVSIRAVREGLNCMLIIHDTGCGIDSTQLLKLQEKLKNTQSPGEGDGRGIGLKNVQERLHIAFGEMYGLEVASDPGKGTTVTMCIPVYQGKETIN